MLVRDEVGVVAKLMSVHITAQAWHRLSQLTSNFSPSKAFSHNS